MSRYVVALITAVPASPARRPFRSLDMAVAYPAAALRATSSSSF
jgi:hypothetical protein